MKSCMKAIFMLLGLLALSGAAYANVTVTRATGGAAIASNTTAGCSATGTWTALTNPVISEGSSGDIGTGDVVLTVPTGFEFNTTASVTILLSGSGTSANNINNLASGSLITAAVTATTITFNVNAVSTSKNTLTWQGIQVRPTASTPLASGNITETGPSTIKGMTASTNLGTLTEVTSSPACNSAPTVTTNAASGLTASGATLNGVVSSNGASTTVAFDYGTTTSYGSSVAATPGTLASGASNAAVSASLTGLSCGTTYHFRVKGVNSLGTTNGSDLSFTTSTCPFACAPPANIPAGVSVTCQCDTFNRATLSPSTIFNANWFVNSSGTTTVYPYINQTTGLLRLTENSGNNATSATVPGIFPAAGNYISVEFQQYAYNGSGADGIGVTLSDYSVTAQPGAFGGSLGYAQKTGINGFAGGWVGVALDEYGNFENAAEGRYGGISASTLYPQSVGVRGSGSGSTNSTPNYPWLRGATAQIPGIDNHTSTTPSLGYFYQVIVDARNAGNPTPQTFVAVNRDTSGSNSGNNYSSLVAPFDIYAANANQAPVPANWQISFTGSTGGSTNIHEIGSLRICAQTMVPPSGGTPSDFNAIDEAYPRSDINAQQGHLYTKLAGTPFTVNVAALNASGTGILTTYAFSGNKTVTVNLIDDSVGTSCNVSAAACSSCIKPVVATQTVTFAKTDTGFKQSGNFTVPAYSNLLVQMSEGTTVGCSADTFAVRPSGIASVTLAASVYKAGSDNIPITATTVPIAGNSGYAGGVPKVNAPSVKAVSPATATGVLAGNFSVASSGIATAPVTSSATAVGNFTYSEVGYFYIQGPDFTLTPTRIPGVYDDTWTSIDSGPKGDCISGTSAAAYSNTKDMAGSFATNTNYGKYGCNFGFSANTTNFGRVIPDHFDTMMDLLSGVPMPCPNGLTCPGGDAPAYSWAYKDAPTRNADTSRLSADIGKIAWQIDTNTFWTLTATTPTWSQFVYSGFVYSSQPFTLNVYARNASGMTTQNYDGAMGLSKAVTLSTWNMPGGATAIANGTLSGYTVLAAAFTSGTTALGMPATPNFTFTTTPTVPTDIYIRATDTDSVTSSRGAASIEGGVKIVSGRVFVPNAYGSELLPLTMTATVQYWGGLNTGYVVSATDNVDIVTAATISRSTCLGKFLVAGACSTTLGTIGAGSVTVPPPYGVYSIKLGAPGAGNSPASEDLTVNSGGWHTSWLPSTTGRASFGVYKGAKEFIYQREAY